MLCYTTLNFKLLQVQDGSIIQQAHAIPHGAQLIQVRSIGLKQQFKTESARYFYSGNEKLLVKRRQAVTLIITYFAAFKWYHSNSTGTWIATGQHHNDGSGYVFGTLSPFLDVSRLYVLLSINGVREKIVIFIF